LGVSPEIMQSGSQPIVKDLVLVGGGHSHAIVLKQFGMNPIAGVRLTLITDVAHTPYSGMLPGYVAGLYRFDDCHIDLCPLSQFAGAQMVLGRAVGLDLQNNRVLLNDRPPVAFDWLSLDIGSTPATVTVPGATDYAIPVKPISRFLNYWEQVVATANAMPDRPLRIAIVGGGAGGVELALSVQARLQQVYQSADSFAADASSSGSSVTGLELHLFHRGNRLLPERGRWLGDRLEQILARRGVQLHLQETVSAIEENATQEKTERQEITVRCDSGLTVACDYVFWVTQASAADWLQKSGLATDSQGFVQVNDTLQSVSHPQVFAAGDVATMINHPRPKAGVFAVRQGQPLYQNLRHALLDRPLRPFVPQKEFLILIGTGDRSALASRSRFGIGPYPWIWQWKDWIDRQFMKKFKDLPVMEQSGQSEAITLNNGRGRARKDSSLISLTASNQQSFPKMHCAGCGSKVGSGVLERVLNRIQQEQPRTNREDILIGLDAPDDAAVVTVAVGQVMVQTIDFFRALVSDAFVFGQICANHCLSDIFAMGATPQSAMAIVTLPYATDAKLEETLYQLLSGTIQVLTQTNAVLIGGHTTEGAELSLGLACNGLAQPDRLWRKSGMQPGQVLILTKPIGTGTLFAADMRLKAQGRWIEGAIESMQLSNQAAVSVLRDHGITACTDVTGFGLAGHLLEMMRASQVSVELDLNALPVLEGAKATVQQGIFSSLYAQNLQASRWIKNLNAVSKHPLYPLLFDPQTSGGLLATVPVDCASACLSALEALGYTQCRSIGSVLSQQDEPYIEIKY